MSSTFDENAFNEKWGARQPADGVSPTTWLEKSRPHPSAGDVVALFNAGIITLAEARELAGIEKDAA